MRGKNKQNFKFNKKRIKDKYMGKQGQIEVDKLKNELSRVKTTLECYCYIPRNLNRINAYKKQIKCLNT